MAGKNKAHHKSLQKNHQFRLDTGADDRFFKKKIPQLYGRQIKDYIDLVTKKFML